MRCSPIVALALACLAACAADPAQDGEDGELPDTLDDGKADSLTAPTAMGELLFWRAATTAVTPAERNLAFEFSLGDKATVGFSTFVPQPESIDDVAPVSLYLYKKVGRSTWKRVVRTTERYTPIDRALDRGTYRVIVRGQKTTTESWVALESSCSGDGCPARDCAYGNPGPKLTALSSAYFPAEPTLTVSVDAKDLAATFPAAELDAGFLRRAVAAASGTPIADDLPLGELAGMLEGQVSRVVTGDDALGTHVFYTFTLRKLDQHSASGDRTVAFSLGSMTLPVTFGDPASRASETGIAAVFAGEATMCHLAPPVCVSDLPRSRYQELADQQRDWYTVDDAPAATREAIARALMPFTGETDAAASLAKLGVGVAESHYRLTLRDTYVPALHMTFFAFDNGDAPAGTAFADDHAYSHLFQSNLAFACRLYVPASNLED
jgi:hypothetical protein